MTRVRLSLDIDPDLKRRIRIASAARDMTVREFVERAVLEALERAEDFDWMESDLSRLEEFEPYEWEEGELEEGDPVRYVPGRGYVVIIDPDKSGGDKSE